jgi:glutamate dehydrogenase
LSSLIERYRNGIDELYGAVESIFDEWLSGRLDDAQFSLTQDGLAVEQARRLAILKALTDAPDIITLAIKLGKPDLEVGHLYFRVSSHFRVDEMRSTSQQQIQSDHYDRLAVNSTLNAVSSAQRAIVEKIYAASGGAQPNFEAWCAANQKAVTRVRNAIDEILNGSELTLAKLTVAVAQLRELAEL